MKFGKFVLKSLTVLLATTITQCILAEPTLSIDKNQTNETFGNSETFEFQAEVSRMLDIVVNSLYQNKDIFLRELISNASDALDKIRFLSISKPNLMEGEENLIVRISFNEEEKTLTINDTGIGMTKEELIQNLGTVARSGTTNFMDALKESASNIEQIGMFGVGFYSSFLVADKVTVASKHPSNDIQYIWSSENGSDSFEIASDPRGNTLKRGTEVTLYMKEDAEEYLDDDKLSEMISYYSEFVTHPIYQRKTEILEVPDDDDDSVDIIENQDDNIEISDDDEPKLKDVKTQKWERANADAALWMRPKDKITDNEYQTFFKSINRMEPWQGNATTWSHFDAEGSINFKALIFMPNDVPAALRNGNFDEYKNGMKLYVRKVLISDSFELLPRYLSFIKGVIDSDDLPLNVNRENLQESKIISIIRKKVTRKTIDMIQKLADDNVNDTGNNVELEIDDNGDEIMPDIKSLPKHPYITWYENFAPSIKMGIMEDEPNRKKVSNLLRFKTSKSKGEYKSLREYVEGINKWQKEIYYIGGTSVKELSNSPFMDKFYEKNIEVIYFTEPADEYMMNHLRDFDGMKFRAITKESISFDDEDKDMNKRIHESYMDKFKPLIKYMQKFYGSVVMRVQISKRLNKVPAIVSSAEYGHSANMERIMRAQGFAHGQSDYMMRGTKTLEINPRHPIITKLLSEIPFDLDELPEIDQSLKDSLWNLLDAALLNGGYSIIDNKAYTNRMIRTLKTQLALDSLELEPEIAPKVVEDKPEEFDLGEHDGINIDDFGKENIEDEL